MTDDQRIDPKAPQAYFNRELSWLAFNGRVLHEATDDRTPLFERVRFLAIAGSNLDEFCSKRLGPIQLQVRAGVHTRSVDGSTPAERLETLRQGIVEQQGRMSACFHEYLQPALAKVGVHLLTWEDLEEAERVRLRNLFVREVYPILTPLAVDPSHPFPFVSNLSLSLAVSLRDPLTADEGFARVKVPDRRRWIRLEMVPDGDIGFVSLRDVITANLDILFPGMEILGVWPFRVTRSAEVEREEDAEDIVAQIRDSLRERRFAEVVRLEVGREMPPHVRDLLAEELEIGEEGIIEVTPPIDVGTLFEIAELGKEADPNPHAPAWADPALSYPPYTPVVPPRLADARSVFEVVRRGDLLVHHPYESFTASVQRFIEESCDDPAVLAIKCTIYRTSQDSPILRALRRAADEGKAVAVLVEVQARFDEARNLEWGQRLEESGVHVAYGVLGLKTHTKLVLVVREEADGLRRYMHIGTGNYNPDTARLYTDLGLFTCQDQIADDVTDLFAFLTGYSRADVYEELLVAPHTARRRFEEMIEREAEHARAGRFALIQAKMNALDDPEVVQALYRASQAGVRIDLVVRGICRLRPGVAGLSENIRVVSIIGRFLEHSRIFRFRNSGDEEFFIGSADWMTRNLDARVEAIAPVYDAALRDKLRHLLDVSLQDNRQAWDLAPDGTWTQRRPAPGEEERATHAVLLEEAQRERSLLA